MTAEPGPPEHRPRILIVDDEVHNRQLLEVMLATEGYLLTLAGSGEEALTLVHQHPPDLIMLDVMMPGVDGYEVATRLKGDAVTQNIPIVMVTSMGDRDARMRGLRAGAEEFLAKPVDRAELCVRVRNLLRLKALADLCQQYSRQLEREVDSRTADVAQSETARRHTDERMRFALEAANVGIWDMDYVTGALQWSDTLEAQYGLSPGMFGRTFESFVERVHADDRESLLATIAAAARNGSDFLEEHRAVWPDGTVRSLAGTGRIYLGKHGEPVRGVGISQDVTERRTLERQHQQSQKMQAIGQLASGVAHDFNNLLTVIIGFTELVGADVEMASQHGKDLGEIIKAAQSATGLTQQLLAFSRQQALHLAPIDVNDLVAEMTAMLGRLIGSHIDMTLALAPDLSPALADRSQLEQVVMNLVVNAKDAMPDGGTLVIETAEVELQNSPFHEEEVTPGTFVMLAVSDSGSGITKETRRRIFEPFFTTKESGKGTGLGLSTTYGIVKQSKGHIWVYSEPGLGTTFKVYLPRAAAEVPLSQIPSGGSNGTAGATETILVVEDELGVREFTRRVLERAGYRVLEAGTGDDAERLFAAHSTSIDLVITDVVMPGCSGPELIARLSRQTQGLKVLYMSGYTEPSIANTIAFDRGVPFVQKPFTAAELVRHVRAALNRQPTTTASRENGQTSQ